MTESENMLTVNTVTVRLDRNPGGFILTYSADEDAVTLTQIAEDGTETTMTMTPDEADTLADHLKAISP